MLRELQSIEAIFSQWQASRAVHTSAYQVERTQLHQVYLDTCDYAMCTAI